VDLQCRGWPWLAPIAQENFTNHHNHDYDIYVNFAASGAVRREPASAPSVVLSRTESNCQKVTNAEL
jgi:hypothetical protein